MSQSAEPLRTEPLFANRQALWVRVWAIVQGAALVIGLYAMVTGSMAAYPRLGPPGYSWSVFAAVVLYHVVGVRFYDRLLSRRWVTALFVPLGWALIVATLRINGVFALLVFGAIIQGFLFLSFTWAIGTLTLVTGLLVALVSQQDHYRSSSLALARVAVILALAVMVATVMAYIHRANRDAATRARLLEELEAAQRDLAERARLAGIQDERQRLARDIHDTLAQGFTSVIKHLEAIELSFAADGASDSTARAALPHLGHAQAVSRESLAEIRRLVWALRPAALDESTLPAAVRRIVAQWSDANAIVATCDIQALPGLSPDAEVTLLRAVQETLSNVARHAFAKHVSVALTRVDSLLMLTIEDDGRGFDAESSATGTGLSGLRARVRPLGGHLLVESTAGKGTSVTVALPVDAGAAT